MLYSNRHVQLHSLTRVLKDLGFTCGSEAYHKSRFLTGSGLGSNEMEMSSKLSITIYHMYSLNSSSSTATTNEDSLDESQLKISQITHVMTRKCHNQS